MALTLGTQIKVSNGARFQTITPITVDTSYPAGGWPLTGAQLGLPLQVDWAYADQSGVTAVGGWDLRYDKQNGKLMAFSGGTATTAAPEVTAATNVSAGLVNLQIVAQGR